MRRLRAVAFTIISALGLVLLWQLVAVTEVAGSTIPTVGDVLAVFDDDRQRRVIVGGIRHTTSSALTGLAIGGAVAAATALTAVLVPVIKDAFDVIATITHAVPLIAIAPVLLATVDRGRIPQAMSAFVVFFVIYTSADSGLRQSSGAHRDLFAVLGASTFATLWRLRIPAGLSLFASGVKLAVPLAFIGAVMGEWFGLSGGIGQVILAAMSGHQIGMLWAAAGTVLVVSLLLYGLASIGEYLVAKWSAGLT